LFELISITLEKEWRAW